MNALTTYLNFDGNTREALTFYEQCLGGELYLMPFSEVQFDYPKEAKDRFMHARLKAGPLVLMASDTLPGMPFRREPV